ncbi:MAG: hypothetical protein IJF84_10300 [Thermoguttaceae bacterium]|nr:hypothetical protein [Thermoguttaceae bacterium]
MKRYLITLLTICIAFCVCSPAFAQNSAFKKLIRSAGRVADDVPIKSMDKAVKPANKKMAQELLEKTARTSDQSLQSLPYAKRLVREIEQTLGSNLDPAVLKSLDEAGEAGVETAFLLSKGAKGVSNTIPDVARRAELLKTLEPDTFCIIGRYGDDLTDSVELFIKSTDSKIIKQAIDPSLVKNADKIQAARRAVTMDDFNNFFRKTGDKGVEFWRTTVKPNWKLFAASGVLAAILIAPESYTDYVIEKTAGGVAKIVRLSGKAVGKTASETTKAFFHTKTGTIVIIVASIIGLIWFFSLSLVQRSINWFINAVKKIKNWLFPPSNSNTPSNKLGPDVD